MEQSLVDCTDLWNNGENVYSHSISIRPTASALYCVCCVIEARFGCTSSVVQQVSLCSQLSQTKMRSALKRMLVRCISPDSVVFHMAFPSLSHSVVLSGTFSQGWLISLMTRHQLTAQRQNNLSLNFLPSIHPSSLNLCLHLHSFRSLLLILCQYTLKMLHLHSFHSCICTTAPASPDT